MESKDTIYRGALVESIEIVYYDFRSGQIQKNLRSKLLSVVWTNHDKEITNESNEMTLFIIKSEK